MYKKIIFSLLITLFALGIHAQEASMENLQATEPEQKESIIKEVEKWYERNMNYGTITLLMTIESSFIPFPSEIVIPPAAYIASKPESSLNIVWVIFFGTLGALFGALINYFLSMWIGRIIIYKFADSKLGHLFLLNSEKIKKAENYFNERGNISTFIGRLIPGIRQLISIPAGLAKMNIFSFMLFTTLGAGIWNIILASVGYIAQGQQDIIDKYSHEISYIMLGLLGLFILYFAIKHIINRKRKTR